MAEDSASKIIKTDPDPTINVQNLLKEAVKRIDDLRQAETRRVDEKIEGEKEHVREVIEIREEYREKLTIAEAKRIDAIRAVDVNAVAVASERATQQATVLATQVSTSAETLRALVASSAAATATQLTQIITPITDRLALLEKAQYTGAGKEGVTDPQLAQLLIEMKATRDSLATGSGQQKGISTSWGIILGAVGFISTILGIILILSRFLP